jgi:hypothetical protein
MNYKKRQANTGILDTITADILGRDGFNVAPENNLRVERILLEMVDLILFNRNVSYPNASTKLFTPTA